MPQEGWTARLLRGAMVALLVSSSAMSISEAKQPSVVPGSPLVVLIKGGNRAKFERPVFVLYDSGLVLFQKAEGFAAWWDGRYFFVTLAPEEVAAILDLFKPGTDFWSLPDVIRAPPLSCSTGIATRNTPSSKPRVPGSV